MRPEYRPSPPVWRERVVPSFIRQWLADVWGACDGVAPEDYLDQAGAPEIVIAASWLFCPETVEYRGGIFLASRFRAENVDMWLDGHDLVRTQATVNLVFIWSLFDNAESPALDAMDEVQLAQAMAECWYGVLVQRYPGHDIRVSQDLDVDESSPKGPSITLWSTGPRAEAEPV